MTARPTRGASLSPHPTIFPSTTLHRRARPRDLHARAPNERRDVSYARCSCARSTTASASRNGAAQLRRVARVALRIVALRRAREGAHGASAARAARDLGRVRGRAAVVLEGARAHACRRESRRGSAARVRARRYREPSRRTLPAATNAEPESVHGARHVWERRSLTLFRDRARGSCGSRSSCPKPTASSWRAR